MNSLEFIFSQQWCAYDTSRTRVVSLCTVYIMCVIFPCHFWLSEVLCDFICKNRTYRSPILTFYKACCNSQKYYHRSQIPPNFLSLALTCVCVCVCVGGEGPRNKAILRSSCKVHNPCCEILQVLAKLEKV